jgi:hypothetical protein
MSPVAEFFYAFSASGTIVAPQPPGWGFFYANETFRPRNTAIFPKKSKKERNWNASGTAWERIWNRGQV